MRNSLKVLETRRLLNKFYYMLGEHLRVTNIVVLFLCSSLGIWFWSLSETTYWPSWIPVQPSPVVSMFLWSGLKVQTRQHGAVWGGRVEQKKPECTRGREQALLLRRASKEVEVGPHRTALLCPRTQHGRNSTEGFMSQNLWHGGPTSWKSQHLHQCSGCYKYRLQTQKLFWRASSVWKQMLPAHSHTNDCTWLGYSILNYRKQEITSLFVTGHPS